MATSKVEINSIPVGSVGDIAGANNAQDYPIAPLAGSATLCECAGSKQTAYELKLKQIVVTCSSSGGISTSESQGTGYLPNPTWTASGTGASTDQGGLFSFTKNGSENSRSMSQSVSFKYKGTTYSDSVLFTQRGRTVDYSNSETSTWYENLDVTFGSDWSYGCEYRSVSAIQTVDKVTHAEYYDTCGDLWSEKSYDTRITETKVLPAVSHTGCESFGNSDYRIYSYQSGTYRDKNGNLLEDSDWVRWNCTDCTKCDNCPEEETEEETDDSSGS